MGAQGGEVAGGVCLQGHFAASQAFHDLFVATGLMRMLCADAHIGPKRPQRMYTVCAMSGRMLQVNSIFLSLVPNVIRVLGCLVALHIDLQLY